MSIEHGVIKADKRATLRGDRVLILLNPRAGSGRGAARLSSLIRELEQRQLDCTVLTDLDALPDQVAALHGAGRLRTVVVAGGDGTVDAIVNRVPTNTPLTLFPLGTENLLAKYLGLNGDPAATCEAICGGRSIKLDAGVVQTGEGSTRLFLLMIGCGFDADVIQRLHRERVGHITRWSYLKPIWESIRSYRYPTLRISCRGPNASPPVQLAHWAFVFNTPSYAIGLTICPQADPADGQLDVATFRGGSLHQGLIHLGAIVMGRRRERRTVTMQRATSVRIEADESVPFQVDGDPGGTLPIEVSVLHERVEMVVPSHWSAGIDEKH
jgi:diacylglycerol kinase family enzyme